MISLTMLRIRGSICRAVERSRFTSFRLDLAEEQNALLGELLIFPPPLSDRGSSFPSFLSYGANQGLSFNRLSSLSFLPSCSVLRLDVIHYSRVSVNMTNPICAKRSNECKRSNQGEDSF